ncbi:MAG: NmrA family NAD(P)-binding protein [Bacteroidota bacterium]
MRKIIVVAGATGNLGGKIIKALLALDVEVRAIVRLETDIKKVKDLEQKGVKVFQVDTSNKSEIAKHCIGAHCLVSALAGLKETVIDTQKIFLDAAVEAKVQRFIPSDYSSDFTNLKEGQNRNLDFRRKFHEYIDKAPIKATTIFNGPFMDLLTTDMPLIMFKQKRILCWGNPNQIIEFTTTYNVADFTAEAAIDDNTPRFLRIAGDRLSCNDFVKLLTELTNEKYKLFRPGGIRLLNVVITLARFFSPSKKELYPAWQGMQYMRDMMEGRIIFQKYDNDRYSNIKWTSVKDFLIKEKINIKATSNDAKTTTNR